MNRSPKTSSLLFAVLLLGLAAGTGCIRAFPPPDPVGFSKQELKAVLNCQDEINDAGRDFVHLKMEKLEYCLQDILAIYMAFDNGLMTAEEYDKKLVKVRNKCDERFAKISKATTRFVDAVIDACTPVEEFILDEDSLRFLLLAEDGELSFDVETVEDLAGALCVSKEMFVDHAVFVQMPRMLELLYHLGEEYVVVTGSNDFTTGYPNIPHDERCPIEDMVGVTQ